MLSGLVLSVLRSSVLSILRSSSIFTKASGKSLVSILDNTGIGVCHFWTSNTSIFSIATLSSSLSGGIDAKTCFRLEKLLAASVKRLYSAPDMSIVKIPSLLNLIKNVEANTNPATAKTKPEASAMKIDLLFFWKLIEFDAKGCLNYAACVTI